MVFIRITFISLDGAIYKTHVMDDCDDQFESSEIGTKS